MSVQLEVSELTDPIVKAFLKKINAAKGPQIYELSPDEARKVLLKVQDAKVPEVPADIEDIEVPGGPKGHIPVRIVRPKGAKGALPVIVYYHGGGWVLGGKETHDHLIRKLANKANAAIAFVEYTLSPEAKYPVPIEQAYTALEYISNNGKKLNLDSSRIAVAGDSVGGNMATVIAFLAKQRKGPRLALQALFYPVTDAAMDTQSYHKFATGHWLSAEAMKWFWDEYLPNKDARKQPTASPLQAKIDMLKGMPPTLLITDEFDVLRDEGEAYARKLAEAGVKVSAVRMLNTVHDFMMLNPLAESPASLEAIEIAGDALGKALKK